MSVAYPAGGEAIAVGHGSAVDGQLTGVQMSDLIFALIGVGALLAGILPRALERRPLSMPIAFQALGMIVFALPLGLPKPGPLAHPALAQHLTEVGVIVALMGAGLKIDRPLGGRRWASTWRLLPIAMPVTIGIGLVVLVSVVAHGIAATPVMRLLDRFNERTSSPRSVTESP